METRLTEDEINNTYRILRQYPFEQVWAIWNGTLSEPWLDVMEKTGWTNNEFWEEADRQRPR